MNIRSIRYSAISKMSALRVSFNIKIKAAVEQQQPFKSNNKLISFRVKINKIIIQHQTALFKYLFA